MRLQRLALAAKARGGSLTAVTAHGVHTKDGPGSPAGMSGVVEARRLCSERCSAAAAFFRVRVLENKARLHQRFFIIERHSAETQNALRVHKNPDAFEFENAVVRARLRVELELITQSGAAAAQHAQAQP